MTQRRAGGLGSKGRALRVPPSEGREVVEARRGIAGQACSARRHEASSAVLRLLLWGLIVVVGVGLAVQAARFIKEL